MSAPTVPLADVVVTEEDIEAVAEVYRSGWLSLGPRTKEFEQRFAEYIGVEYAVAVCNGTAALHLACVAAGLGPGDEVIVPSLTFVATVNAVAYTGAQPVFADIASPLEPWLSAGSVETVTGERTKAVMTMSYGGHPGETDRLAELCARRDLLLLEDAAHGLGARLDGRHLGTFGQAGAFSFFSNKNLSVGEGGAVATSDPELASRVRLLRSHGMTALSWDRHRGHASEYDVVDLGFNYRIDEPRSALAAKRLERLESENARRAELDARYRDRMAALGVECPMAPRQGSRGAHHLFCILLPPGVDRTVFRQALAERGVQTSMHYPPAHRFSIYADGAPNLPLTDTYAERTVTLPLFAHMTDEQQDQVSEAVAAALGPA